VSNERTTVKTELGRIWKEVVMAYFNTVSQHLPAGTKENHINLREKKPPKQELNQVPPPKQTAGVLITQL
jgi:hypothetical protein